MSNAIPPVLENLLKSLNLEKFPLSWDIHDGTDETCVTLRWRKTSLTTHKKPRTAPTLIRDQRRQEPVINRKQEEKNPVPESVDYGQTCDLAFEGNPQVCDADSMNFLRRTFSGKKSHPKMSSHIKARCKTYPRCTVERFELRDEEVDWSTDFPQYKPVNYTSPSVVSGPEWADPDFSDPKVPQPKWNSLDGQINRCSHTGKYKVIEGIPRNPVGRTGLKGRGALGKWGPNHAADPLVTRWKRDSAGKKVKDSNKKPIVEFVAIQRRDTGEWAIPGGMVDAGEVVSETLRREFGEEAMNSLVCSEKEKKEIRKSIKNLFSKGTEVFRGYVDDPRNTDNAWMETVAMNFHDDTGESVGKIQLCAGDDAVGVKWMEINSKLKLYASHVDFLEKCVKLLNASW